MTRTRTALLALLALGIPAALLAQPDTPAPRFDHRLELSGGGAFARTWDDEGSIGLGASFGGTVLFPVRPTIGVGATIGRIAHDRETGYGSLHFNGDSTVAGALGKFTFGTARVRPFATAGFGVLFYSGTLISGPPRGLPPGVPVPEYPTVRVERSGTETYVSGSGGVDIWITKRLAARPFAGIYMTQASEDFMPWSIITGGVSLAVKW